MRLVHKKRQGHPKGPTSFLTILRPDEKGIPVILQTLSSRPVDELSLATVADTDHAFHTETPQLPSWPSVHSEHDMRLVHKKRQGHPKGPTSVLGTTCALPTRNTRATLGAQHPF